MSNHTPTVNNNHRQAMKKTLTIGLVLALSLTASAQGGNTRMGGNDGDYESLAERIGKLEKKNDAFNVYFNYAASAQMADNGDEWSSRFANKQLRLEIKGNITDKLFYRLRHRMNKANNAKGQDNFAKATDIMMVGYNFSDQLTVMGGKMCQIWGGFEFDENPMYIYEYSDMVENMDNFMAGVVVSYKPVATQEIAFEVSDANNGKLNEDYGDNLVSVGPQHKIGALRQANHPLTFIANCSDSVSTCPSCNGISTTWEHGMAWTAWASPPATPWILTSPTLRELPATAVSAM